MKIAIAGTGYVGLSNAILLAQHHDVTAVDVIPEKVDMVNRKESPIADAYIEDYLKNRDLSLTATLDGDSAYRNAELIIIAAPTNYDDVTGRFDTRAVGSILAQIRRVGSKAVVIIKSTIHRLHQENFRPVSRAFHPLCAGISSGREGPLRQPLSLPHYCRHSQREGSPPPEGPALCFPHAGRSH